MIRELFAKYQFSVKHAGYHSNREAKFRQSVPKICPFNHDPSLIFADPDHE